MHKRTAYTRTQNVNTGLFLRLLLINSCTLRRGGGEDKVPDMQRGDAGEGKSQGRRGTVASAGEGKSNDLRMASLKWNKREHGHQARKERQSMWVRSIAIRFLLRRVTCRSEKQGMDGMGEAAYS